MSNTEFKKAFDNVSPDMFMETRMLAGIKEKRKKPFPLKAVISGVLALVVAVTCIGGIHYKTTYTDRPFSVMVVDASDEMNITAEITDEAVHLPLLTINYDPKGSVSVDLETGEGEYSPTVGTNSDCGLSVTGDDIAYVQYECKKDTLVYWNTAKMYYDIENQDYYSVIIPVDNDRLDEVTALIQNEKQALKDYAEICDITEYFGNKSTDLDDYQVTFSKCSDLGYPEYNDGYAFYLVENNWGERYEAEMDSEITVEYYELTDKALTGFTGEEITAMYAVDYLPSQAMDVLFENPDVDKSTLPGDEITVTVTFKDGKKARKVITVSFDDEGYAQFSLK